MLQMANRKPHDRSFESASHLMMAITDVKLIVEVWNRCCAEWKDPIVTWNKFALAIVLMLITVLLLLYSEWEPQFALLNLWPEETSIRSLPMFAFCNYAHWVIFICAWGISTKIDRKATHFMHYTVLREFRAFKICEPWMGDNRVRNNVLSVHLF